LDATFTIRLKRSEKKRFEALAAAAGLSLTAWARQVLLRVSDGTKASPKVARDGRAPGRDRSE
jgi:hypothetical protein